MASARANFDRVACHLASAAHAAPCARATTPRAPAKWPISNKKHRRRNRLISSSSSTSSSSSSPLSSLLSFLAGKYNSTTPLLPPGIELVSGSGREVDLEAKEVAELWRSSGFEGGSTSGTSERCTVISRSLSELTTGLPISGSDERRVATALFYSWKVVAAFAEVDDEADEEGGKVKRRKELVGLARLLSDGSFAAHLSDVVVRPDCRGRGIGRALVAAAVSEARKPSTPCPSSPSSPSSSGGASSVVAWVRPGRARLFLQRCGFRISVAYRVLRYEGD